MSIIKKIGCILLGCFIFAVMGCEEESTEPLTLDDLYEASEGDRPLFRTFLNGREFSSESAQGAKVGDEIIITGGNGKGQLSINLTDFIQGTYLGIDSVNNQIKYTDASGRQFLSNRAGEKSDAKVIITYYNEDESRISGRFSGLLYDLNFTEDIYLTNGAFNELFINAPFFGRMTAVIGNLNFNSDRCFYSSTPDSSTFTDLITATAKDDTSSVTFQIEEKVQVGTYDLRGSIASATYLSNVFSSDKQTHEYLAKTGSLVVASVDSLKNKIRGSFNFVATNQNGESINVSNGNYSALIN